MKLLLRMLGRFGDFSNVQPLPALFLGGAVLALFLSAMLRRTRDQVDPKESGLLWTLYRQSGTWLWAMFLVHRRAGWRHRSAV